jgi:hypothetical protein
MRKSQSFARGLLPFLKGGREGFAALAVRNAVQDRSVHERQ